MSEQDIFKLQPDAEIVCDILRKSAADFEAKKTTQTNPPPPKHAVIGKWKVNGYDFEDTIFEPTNSPADLCKQIERCINRKATEAQLILYSGKGEKNITPLKTITLIFKEDKAPTQQPQPPQYSSLGLGSFEEFDKRPLSTDPALISMQFMMVRDKAQAKVDTIQALWEKDKEVWNNEKARLENEIAELEAELIDSDAAINGLEQGVVNGTDKWGRLFGSIASNALEGFVIENPKLLKHFKIDEEAALDIFGDKLNKRKEIAAPAAPAPPGEPSFTEATEAHTCNEDSKLFEGIDAEIAEPLRELIKMVSVMEREDFRKVVTLFLNVSDNPKNPTAIDPKKVEMAAYLMQEYLKANP